MRRTSEACVCRPRGHEQVGDSVAVRTANVWNPQKLYTFSGVVIARRAGQVGASFTLRNHIEGFAVEQSFPLNSPLLRGIRRVKVLYFLHEDWSHAL